MLSAPRESERTGAQDNLFRTTTNAVGDQRKDAALEFETPGRTHQYA